MAAVLASLQSAEDCIDRRGDVNIGDHIHVRPVGRIAAAIDDRGAAGEFTAQFDIAVKSFTGNQVGMLDCRDGNRFRHGESFDS